MKITTLRHNDFKGYKKIISKLLKVSYLSNFEISEEICDNIVINKLKELEDYLESSKAILIGAIINNNLVGFIWLYIHDYFGKSRMHINQIVVDTEYRGRGVAKKLLAEAETQASKLGLDAIDLIVSEENTIAVKLYEDLGYSTERRYLKKNIGGTEC